MSRNELAQRIKQYRETYLDTAAGRKHRQTEIDERDVIKVAFADINSKFARGEDITDIALLKLLPHQDTEYNRGRGAHTSTWPCITRDVVQWFEGAKWKQPGDWPSTSRWILDIVEAGRTENWVEWKRLAILPSQKGFQCGFITPIVHCLNSNLPVLNSKVVRTFANVADQLGLSTDITVDLSSYPDNKDRILKMVEQLKSLGLNDLVEWDIYCHWNVAKRLGGGASSIEIPDSAEEVAEIVETIQHTPSPTSHIGSVGQELIEAQYDIAHPDRFEIAIAKAFEALGLETEQIGGPGKADVVAHAALGDESFKLIADAKAHAKQDTRHSAPFGYSQIRKHQEDNTADYAVVIANDFGSGNTEEFARKENICLMRTDDLVGLLEEHARCALSLEFIRSLFHGKSGRISVPVKEHVAPLYDRFAVLIAVLETFETLQRDTDSEEVFSLNAETVSVVLRSQKKVATRQQIQDAISFLANPTVNVLKPREAGFVLTMPAHYAAMRVQAIANTITGAFAKTKTQVD